MTTARLLAYRSRLLELEDSADRSDWSRAELASLDPSRVCFKDDARWIELYDLVRSVLATREHVR